MANIRIVTDSTADLPAEIREKYGIEMIPLKVHFGEEVFLDSVNISADEFYNKLVHSEQLPKTSQPSPADFLDLYKNILAEDPQTEIISIHLSAALSGTYQSAVLAKSLLDENAKITLIDSRSASIGLGNMVLTAAKAAKEGADASECVRRIEQIQQNMGLFFLVDTLEYLQKGGRIGKAAAMVGTLLNIKPILTIDHEGEVASVDKVRGQKKAIERIIEQLNDRFSNDQPVNVQFAHSSDAPQINLLRERITSVFNVVSSTETMVGPVIGTHVGPGTIAVNMVPADHD